MGVEAHHFFIRTDEAADRRAIGKEALDEAHGLKELELTGILPQEDFHTGVSIDSLTVGVRCEELRCHIN
jgi:hypothetical protein